MEVMNRPRSLGGDLALREEPKLEGRLEGRKEGSCTVYYVLEVGRNRFRCRSQRITDEQRFLLHFE
jgi:hypothetical protein